MVWVSVVKEKRESGGRVSGVEDGSTGGAGKLIHKTKTNEAQSEVLTPRLLGCVLQVPR